MTLIELRVLGKAEAASGDCMAEGGGWERESPD
jgi:hypothetical protein